MPDRYRVTPPKPIPIHWIARVAIGVVVLALGVGIFAVLAASAPEVEVTDPTENRPQVVVFKAQQIPIARQWRGYGTAEAIHTADIPARITATVDRLAEGLRPGAAVAKDQPLVWLDASDYEHQSEIAKQRIAELDALIDQLGIEERRLKESLELEESDVALAQTDYDRQVGLEKRNVANVQDVENATRVLTNAKRSRVQTAQQLDSIPPRRASLKAQLASQKANADLAALSVERSVIRSPLAGVLESIEVEVGENIAAGQPVARVVSPDIIEVAIKLRAAAAGRVGVGDPVTLSPTNRLGEGGPVWRTKVVRVSPKQDAATRTLTVYVELRGGDPPPPGPGTFLEALVSSGEKRPEFIVPRRAIRDGRVQVVKDGVIVGRSVEERYVFSGKSDSFEIPDDQWSVIGDALSEGELVVVNAATQYTDGQHVEPVVAGGGQ